MKRLLLGLPLALCLACTPQGDPGIGGDGYHDDFDRSQLGDDWHNTGGPWQVRDGALRVRGARNRPLWLRRTLPRDVKIAFDVKSDSPEGDIKAALGSDDAKQRSNELNKA